MEQFFDIPFHPKRIYCAVNADRSHGFSVRLSEKDNQHSLILGVKEYISSIVSSN